MRQVTLKCASEIDVGDVVSSPNHSGVRLKRAKIVKSESISGKIKLWWFGEASEFYKWCSPHEEFIVEKE